MRRRIDLRLLEWTDVTHRTLRAALEWWLLGLFEPLPPQWRRQLLAFCGRVLLEQRGGDWTATWAVGFPPQATEGTVGLVPGDTFDAVRARLGASASARAILVLSTDAVLYRRLSLPAAAPAVLKNVVRHEVERLTPVAKAELAVQHCVARHDRVQKRVLVDIFVARASMVEDAVAKWRELGWPIGCVTVRCRGELLSSLDFLPAKQRSRAARLSLPVPRWPTALLGLAAVLALYAPALRYSAVLEAQAATLAELRGEALGARDTLTYRDDLASRERFLAQLRAERVPALVVLDELTRILPDHTWLQQIHLSERLQVQGESSSASTVVQLLEQSAVFTEAQFSAPISTAAGDSRERFVIDVAVGPREPR